MEETSKPSANSGPEASGPALEAFPGQKGEIKEGTFLGMRIKYQQIGEHKVFDGDILLSDQQLAAQPNARTQGAGVVGYDDNNLESGGRWPGNVIYYTMNIVNPDIVTTAMERIESQTNVEFVLRTTEPNYVSITNSAGNASFTGMVGGSQGLTLTTNANAGTALHELGHTIGLIHEHNRSDRNDYLNINLNNANPDYHDAYNIYDGYNGFNYEPFDFSSVMIYSSLGFSINNQPVLTKKDGSTFISTSNSPDAVLSAGDVALINAMYPGLGEPSRNCHRYRRRG